MVSDNVHEQRAEEWLELIFGGRANFRRTAVPNAAVWFLAYLADPPAREAVDFTDWSATPTVGNASTGSISVITKSSVLNVSFVDCSPEDPGPDQLSGWVRDRSFVHAIEMRAIPQMITAGSRAEGCVTLRFAPDNSVLNLPHSDRRSVSDLMRVLVKI